MHAIETLNAAAGLLVAAMGLGLGHRAQMSRCNVTATAQALLAGLLIAAGLDWSAGL